MKRDAALIALYLRRTGHADPLVIPATRTAKTASRSARVRPRTGPGDREATLTPGLHATRGLRPAATATLAPRWRLESRPPRPQGLAYGAR
jgi:hypothetical protein